MFVHIPALKGKMGTRTYYSCLMPLEAIQNMFKFDPDERQWTDLSPEQREQRALNKSRVPAISSYIWRMRKIICLPPSLPPTSQNRCSFLPAT